MPVAFTLNATDYKLLERAVAARFHRTHGRLHVAFIVQVLAWMFMTMAAMSFYKLWLQDPQPAQPYGVLAGFALLAFLLVAVRSFAANWVYQRYVAASNASFSVSQTVEVRSTELLLNSSVANSVVPRTSILDYSEDDQNYYLFLSGVQAIVIPKDAAQSLGPGFAQFLAALRSEAH